MPAPETLIGAIMLASLTIYALGGGADFGGGVWDLLAAGPRSQRQRELIAHAIGPVWEANHVWLILVVVLLFACFPPAFAAIGTALHIPLSVMLLGIVLRGTAFTFRAYDLPRDDVQRRWSRLFAIASLVTPVTLGTCVGAVAAGRVHTTPEGAAAWTNFVSPWLAPFPIAVGVFTLALFALLAAVYLTMETTDMALRRAFRARALWAAAASGVMAFGCLWLAREGAPRMFDGLLGRAWSLPFQLVTGLSAIGVIVALLRERFAAARMLVIVQVSLIVWGWGLAQFPYVVPPRLTLAGAAAPRPVLDWILSALGVGALLLFPSLFYLFHVFKRRAAAETTDDGMTGSG